MSTIHGRIKLGHHEQLSRPFWAIECVPHVMIRLKRNFPRLVSSKTGVVSLGHTRDVAADLVWFMSRFELAISEEDLAFLTAESDEHHARQAQVAAMLEGYKPPPGGEREPAVALRDYQQLVHDLAELTGGMLNGDDVGVGKTHPALAHACNPDNLPMLCVVPTLLPTQWARRASEIVPWLSVHIAKKGTPPPDEVTADIIILNYAKLAGWSYHLRGRLGSAVFDEAQELRRDGTEKYKAAHRVCEGVNLRLGLTATPVYNYGIEMYNIMSVLAPDVLGTRSEFFTEWGGGGANGSIADPKALGTFLREAGVFIRRTREDVGRELPEVQDPVIELDVTMNDIEKADESGELERLAKVLLDPESKHIDVFQATGDMDWRMRQATGVAKARQVAEFVKMLLTSGEAVVLFAWHREVYDIWEQALKDHAPVFVTGHETTKQKLRSTDDFMEGRSNLLIVSLRSGAGLDGLQERAHICVFGELDWAPGVHHQCIGRLHRDGQDEPVIAYYLVATEGSDPVIADTLELKRQQSEPITDPDRPMRTRKADMSDRMRDIARAYLDRKKR